MKLIRHTDPEFPDRWREIAAPSSLFDAAIEQRARTILTAVQERGDDAVLEFTERFDGAKLEPSQIAVTQAELLTASLKADPQLRSAVAEADRNVATFARKSRRKNWATLNSHGAKVGEKFDPFQRVGVYIPGGAAPLVSTALMTVTLARVAGCPEIVVCTPCGHDGSINPALLYAARKAGATEIYRIGGAQAIGAMAYGTQTVRKVQKIFGPGNAYVVAAKRLVVGYVAIDLLPGPSELLVIADGRANPAYIASDLIAQVEHGSGHERVWLVTDSGKLLKAVEKEILKQTPRLERQDYIRKALDQNAWLIQVKSLKDAVRVTNELAPEHCEVITANPAKLSEDIVTAGAIFLGPWSPTVLGDYVAGPSHTLPTGGAGVSFAGLSVDQFQRRTSLIQYDQAALRKALPGVRKFAALEGLTAHGHSAEIRLISKGTRSKRK